MGLEAGSASSISSGAAARRLLRMRGRSLRPCSEASEGLLRAGMVAPLFAGIGPRTARARKEAPRSEKFFAPPRFGGSAVRERLPGAGGGGTPGGDGAAKGRATKSLRLANRLPPAPFGHGGEGGWVGRPARRGEISDVMEVKA